MGDFKKTINVVKDELTEKIEQFRDKLRELNLNETLLLGELHRLDLEYKHEKIGSPEFNYATTVRPIMQQELIVTRDVKADLLEVIRVITKLRLAIKMRAIGEPLEDSVELIEAEYNMLNSILEPDLEEFEVLKRKCYTLIVEANGVMQEIKSQKVSLISKIRRGLNEIFRKND